MESGWPTGDIKVATCISCHGAHGVRLVNDARSPAFPTNVAATCGACHASTEHMKGYTLPDGKPLPTSQRADYQRSVHYAALTKNNDLSAPTCNDCHGNHGAAPPGVELADHGVRHVSRGLCDEVRHERARPDLRTGLHRMPQQPRGAAALGRDARHVKPHGLRVVPRATRTIRVCRGRRRCGRASTGSSTASTQSAALIARAKNAGMEVGDDELALNEARTKLVLARTEMHAFDPASLDPVVDDGTKILAASIRPATRARRTPVPPPRPLRLARGDPARRHRARVQDSGPRPATFVTRVTN